ncbi:MAG: YadA-like family protein [Gammaproteobacteria bacterium]
MEMKNGNSPLAVRSRRSALLAACIAGVFASGGALAATNIDLGVGATVTAVGPADTVVVTANNTQVTGTVQVGTATTTVTPVATPGAGGGGILPYVVDNGDGTSTVYTITDTGAKLTTTTTTTATGGVTLDPNGNITGQSGGVTTQTTTNTSDVATAVIIDNVTGLPLPADPRNAVGVLGTYDPLAGSFVADGGTTVVGAPVTVSTGGGNLAMSGAGSFGANVTMNGNRVTALADGVIATDAATVGQVVAADTTLQTNIDAEAATRAAADTTLQTNIDAEAATRAAADTTLQANIDAEAATRAAADATLQANITAEATTRAAADTTLQANITAEANTRAAADTTLQSNITAEATARAAADTTLQSNIAAEATARAAADTTLQSNITAEANARILGDQGLHRRVDIAEKGVAMAMAMAAIPTVDYGDVSLGVGVGHFKGETAASVGASFKMGDRAKFRVNFAAGGGETGGSAGFVIGF